MTVFVAIHKNFGDSNFCLLFNNDAVGKNINMTIPEDAEHRYAPNYTGMLGKAAIIELHRLFGEVLESGTLEDSAIHNQVVVMHHN